MLHDARHSPAGEEVNQSDLKPARDYARLFGCKIICFGGTGSGKTPIINSCVRPVLLACEPGLLSMRGSTVPTYYAENCGQVDAFFEWFFKSTETKNFDTLAVDSISFMADVYLQAAIKNNKHGLAAYGEMATNVIKHLRSLYYTREKHTYLIAKENIVDNVKRPYFPGNQLNVEVPGLYDFILHLGIKNVPVLGMTKAFQCIETYDVMARARTGNLFEYEEPNVSKLVAKAMS